MRKRGKDIFSLYLGKHGLGLWVSLFFLVLGISIGAFSEKMMGVSQKSDLLDFVNSYFNVMHLESMSKSQVFFESLVNNFQLLGIVFLSGVIIIGFPIAIAAITFRGITIGFVTAFFMEEMKAKGIMLAVFSILPQNLILVPVFTLAVTIAMGFSFSVLSQRKNPVSRKGYLQLVSSYISVFIIFSILIFAGCLIESYICPVLIKMIVAI